jgi:hypothetical protein
LSLLSLAVIYRPLVVECFEHWRSGYNDAVRTLRHPEVLQRANGSDGVFTFDLAFDGHE